jgi:hypothetical protein
MKCGSAIDAYAEDFKDLVLDKGMSREQAFEELGFGPEDACCRDSFTSPCTVFFDMQNSEAVEGLIEPKNLQVPKQVKMPKYAPQFGTCLSNVALTSGPRYKGLEQVKEKTESLFDEEDEILGLEEVEQNLIPTIPGVPVINVSLNPNKYVSVGADKYTMILSGRTYMAN